jgi:hypothetical protein
MTKIIYKIITTKKEYFTEDKEVIREIKDFVNKIEYGKKPKLPTFMYENMLVIINPQYIVAIEGTKTEIIQ